MNEELYKKLLKRIKISPYYYGYSYYGYRRIIPLHRSSTFENLSIILLDNYPERINDFMKLISMYGF